MTQQQSHTKSQKQTQKRLQTKSRIPVSRNVLLDILNLSEEAQDELEQEDLLYEEEAFFEQEFELKQEGLKTPDELSIKSELFSQLCQIIITDQLEIKPLSYLFYSPYMASIERDLKKWISLNISEAGRFEQAKEKITINPRGERKLYDELKKNCRNIRILLPDLSIIYLWDIYKFRREINKEQKQRRIINALCEIYRENLLDRSQDDISESYEQHILAIKGIKGHTKDFALYKRSIFKFISLLYTYRDSGGSYDEFAAEYLDMKKAQDREFLDRYGEVVWNRLKRR